MRDVRTSMVRWMSCSDNGVGVVCVPCELCSGVASASSFLTCRNWSDRITHSSCILVSPGKKNHVSKRGTVVRAAHHAGKESVNNTGSRISDRHFFSHDGAT